MVYATGIFEPIMNRPSISVTVITLNEEANLSRCLKSVAWADELIVIDSGSTDQTVKIARDAGAQVFTHPWPGYGQQKNFAQSKCTHDWVLNLDADEEVPPELAQEINNALTQGDCQGYLFPRKTFYLGRWIRYGGWYPNYLVRLANKKYAAWTEPNVHEELKVEGKLGTLQSPLNHYTFSSIQEQILTNVRYARLGSEELRLSGQSPSLIKLIFKPIGKFFETYLIKRGFLDGLAGFIISVNAAHSMFLKYANLFEARLRKLEL